MHPQMSSNKSLALSNPQAEVRWGASASGSSQGLSVGSVNHLGWSDVQHHWWPNYDYYHVVPTTTYISSAPRTNATEAAFKIVSKMMKDGIIEDLTVGKFVKLVNAVADIVKREC